MANRCDVLPSVTEQNQLIGLTLIYPGWSSSDGRLVNRYKLKGLILAQNERWRRGLGMQVVRETN